MSAGVDSNRVRRVRVHELADEQPVYELTQRRILRRADELFHVRRELRVVREERDVLAKAIAFFTKTTTR